MRLFGVLHSGTKVIILARYNTEQRLEKTCFRGLDLALAGNFCKWRSLTMVLANPLVMHEFLCELDDLWGKRDFGTHSLKITTDKVVGWESTASINNYDQESLEPFSLNGKVRGLRVKLSHKDLLAPQTCELTIIFEFKAEGGDAVCVIHSIYPGHDIGELDGDVTKREGRVFFDWSHPGEVK